MKRYITLTDGTGMGDSVHVFKTNAPVDELKTLEKISNDVYANGGGYEDVPIWEEVLTDKGYEFDHVDSHEHITPYGTSAEWIKDKYASIDEHYEIDNEL